MEQSTDFSPSLLSFCTSQGSLEEQKGKLMQLWALESLKPVRPASCLETEAGADVAGGRTSSIFLLRPCNCMNDAHSHYPFLKVI